MAFTQVKARAPCPQAELARALKSWDAQNSQLEADTFDQQAHIEAVLEALPNASAITFSSEQILSLLSAVGRVITDATTPVTRIEALAQAYGCSFAFHG